MSKSYICKQTKCIMDTKLNTHIVTHGNYWTGRFVCLCNFNFLFFLQILCPSPSEATSNRFADPLVSVGWSREKALAKDRWFPGAVSSLGTNRPGPLQAVARRQLCLSPELPIPPGASLGFLSCTQSDLGTAMASLLPALRPPHSLNPVSSSQSLISSKSSISGKAPDHAAIDSGFSTIL